MPSAPPRACTCGGIIRNGKCDRCTKGTGHARKTTERGYGWDWQQFRATYLRQHPLCVDCKANGKVAEANEVHHRIKIKHAPRLRLHPDNLMALCKTCHDARSARGE